MRDAAETPAEAFAHVRSWVFDLDNTLYPPHVNLFTQVDQRITTWIADFHGIDGLSARELQKHYYRQFGTSLNGLMTIDRIDPADFLDFVHDIDHSAIHPDRRLAAAVEALPGRKYVLTNGSRRHAEQVTRVLGIDHLFDDLFDIVASEYTPKPKSHGYRLFLDKHGIEPGTAAMFEDLARNLEVPHALGMRTVLVVGAAAAEVRHHWDEEQAGAPHVDHVTDDLPAFLESVRPSA
jgi:putative hydrolase of the HAD superfamily